MISDICLGSFSSLICISSFSNYSLFSIDKNAYNNLFNYSLLYKKENLIIYFIKP